MTLRRAFAATIVAATGLLCLGVAHAATPARPPGIDDASWQSLAKAIDESQAQQQKLTGPGGGPGADGAAGDNYGTSVAVDGNLALVGAPFADVGAIVDCGAAYLYTRNASNQWVLTTKFVASDRADGDAFGSAVAISGDHFVIGAPKVDAASATDAGAAYFFRRIAGVWTPLPRVVLDGANDRLGTSVAIDGTDALIGDPGENAAVFYRFGGSTWTLHSVANGPIATARFGLSVAMSGARAIVGGPDGNNTGYATTYARNASNNWVTEQTLTVADAESGDQVGYSVAISGTRVAIGSPAADNGLPASYGGVLIFERTSSTWTQRARIRPADGSGGDRFGHAVALAGTTVLIGSIQADVGSNNDQGAGYVFVKDNLDAWVLQTKFVAPNGGAGDRLGFGVALSTDTAIVGAPLQAVGAHATQGTARVYRRTSGSWNLESAIDSGLGHQGDSVGAAVAIDGNHALVGASTDDTGGLPSRGAVHAFLRQSNGTWQRIGTLVANNAAAGDLFGYAIAIDGTVALIGAPGHDNALTDELGAAYVFEFDGAEWTQRAFIEPDGGAGDHAGTAVALAGGTAIIGARDDDVGSNAEQGSVYVYTRVANSWSLQTKLVAGDGAANDSFGHAVALSNESLIIGAYRDATGGFADRGSAYVYVRSGGAWSLQQKLVAADGAATDYFGAAVDLDGDTALVGAMLDDVTAVDQGSAYVFVRAGGTWSLQQKLVSSDAVAQAYFGNAVALDGDRLLIGSYNAGGTLSPGRGAAYFYWRIGGAWGQRDRLIPGDAFTGDLFGYAVALDGPFSVIGAPGDDGVAPYGGPGEGSAYLYGKRYDVMYHAEAHGAIVGNAFQEVDHGANGAAVTAVTDAGYAFAGWSDGYPFATRQEANVTADLTVTARVVPAPTVTIADTAVLEGDAGTTMMTFTLTRSRTDSVSAVYVTTDGGLATPGIDYQSLNDEPVTFELDGPASRTVTVPIIGDTTIEPTENLGLFITQAIGATVVDDNAVGEIQNDDAVTLTPTVLPAATPGVPYNVVFSAQGGIAPYTYGLAGGALPSGITLSPAGVLAGMTSATGAFPFQVRVEESSTPAAGGPFSFLRAYTLVVGAGADLQLALDNGVDQLDDGQQTVYTLVAANAGPCNVTGATLTDALPATLANPTWTCVQAQSTATCPMPTSGTGDLSVAVTLASGQFIRYDVMVTVNAQGAGSVANVASIAPPSGVIAINPGDDSAVDEDPVGAPVLFRDGFENPPTPLTVRGADAAMH